MVSDFGITRYCETCRKEIIRDGEVITMYEGKEICECNKKGKYIIIEGCDGCGKSTQAEMLYDYLIRKNIPCYLGREPGGVKSAEEMREILKNKEYDISPIGELFGFEFARAEFFDKVVIPKLKAGVNVITDRSGYSTEAYQGYASGVDLDNIRFMNKIATGGIQPDLAVIIDIDPSKGLEKEIVKDRFSNKGPEYHKKVRQGFLKVARTNPNICKIINYIPDGKNEMQNQIRKYVDKIILN